MAIDILVEEPSAEAALKKLVPKIIGDNISFRIIVFQGKPDVLNKLPQRLRAYAHWQGAPRVVVLVDRDDDDCGLLKRSLERLAVDAGLSTKSTVGRAKPFQVVNRIAVEELEAWFFGDNDALRAAYPKVPATLEKRVGFRDPDKIQGGTAEALERILKEAGHLRGRLSKIQVAGEVAHYMDPQRNRSHSFNVFCVALRAASGD